MTVFFWRWITSHYGDDDSMKKYFDWGKTDLWGFVRFLDTKHATIISNFRDEPFRGTWFSECISLQRSVNKVRALREPSSSEGFVSKSARFIMTAASVPTRWHGRLMYLFDRRKNTCYVQQLLNDNLRIFGVKIFGLEPPISCMRSQLLLRTLHFQPKQQHFFEKNKRSGIGGGTCEGYDLNTFHI